MDYHLGRRLSDWNCLEGVGEAGALRGCLSGARIPI
jgi:hypothetical protein